MELKLGYKERFVFVIVILILTDLAILLNIPFLRQIIGFLFLTILPGLLILQVLKLDKIDSTEKLVLSVGLSISFLMFIGLLINNLSLSIGYGTPLSTIHLLISFNLAFVVLAIVGYKINREVVLFLPYLNLTASEKAFLIVPILFPAFSIFGMHIMNMTDNNFILMFLLFLIPIYVAFVCFFNHKFPKRIYPVVIFLMSISLLLMLALRSNHIIIGADTGREFFFFQTTLDSLHWDILKPATTLDACLSISLLPSIYQSFLNIYSECLFKLLYSLLFSILPLVVYILCIKYFGNFYAFLASFFFMAQATSSFGHTVARSTMAVLFIALATMVLFHNSINEFSRKLLFVIFTTSIIVSHYSTAYIFLYILSLTWIGIQVLPRIITREERVLTLSESHPVEENSIHKAAVSKLSVTSVMLFFTLLFVWYCQLTQAPFTAGVEFVQNTILSLHEFFILESREGVPALFGVTMAQTGTPQRIEFVFTWMMLILIGIGVISLLYKYKKMASLPGQECINQRVLKTEVELEYIAMALSNSLLLVVAIALPSVANGFDIGRIYPPALVVLTLCFIVGGISAARFLKIRKSYWIILIVSIVYFMCTTGTLNQVFDNPRSIVLNSEGQAYNKSYIHDQESYASKWLKVHKKDEEVIYTDAYGFEVLMSQAKIPPSQINWQLIPWYEAHGTIDGYIYLRYRHVINKEMTVHRSRGVEEYSLAKNSDIFTGKNLLYNNGGSETLK